MTKNERKAVAFKALKMWTDTNPNEQPAYVTVVVCYFNGAADTEALVIPHDTEKEARFAGDSIMKLFKKQSTHPSDFCSTFAIKNNN